MHDIQLAPVILQILGDEPSVTMVELVLAAEQAAIVHDLPGETRFGSPCPHEVDEPGFICRSSLCGNRSTDHWQEQGSRHRQTRHQ